MIDTEEREPLNGIALSAARVVGTLMSERGVTRVQIADVLGIHKNLIGQYLGVQRRRGGPPTPPWRPFDLKQLQLLAEFFEWDWDEFLDLVLHPGEPLTNRLAPKDRPQD
ncbi:hypothetical protein [Agromyces larvae]|uniref:XRE family transcriptional regulator n=1 Tax=Agromyces larvae TaxID=2929802 RepID=A0ABY4C206_9MICO|nr:hypothetical protein [Agromyces larvae]UOE45516.1 hypothetical protein MTO99_07090 [Agromyces larvae]